ncbi:LOW QUALITY PROTEIN: putative BOI-related E3 ubiquitin-protein ligase 2 [Primulina tabacum]|uniref:LOW QUALITY PROTEIN: putative BOI-related E3 ubiquitin-protein ligase 2 n=1 Tax=Primulina tabacum TaxID=48773 RepID=UPI003F5A7C4D
MAVEARHLHLFPPRVLSNGNLMMNGVEVNENVYGTPLAYGVMTPLSGMSAAMDPAVLVYGSAFTNTVTPKAVAMKSDSGITCAMPVSRKRSRDPVSPLLSTTFTNVLPSQNANNRCGSFNFLGEDISSHIQQQQMEIDLIISQHTEKVRMEMEERRRRYSTRFAAAVQQNIAKKLKAKEEEIEKIEKLNCALEEKVKLLSVENQIWRDLAQTNEATANALRCDLEQVLTHVQDEHQQHLIQRCRADEVALLDDAQSCCGSNYEEIGTLASAENQLRDNADYGVKSGNRTCRSCGKEESCVLLLPCRHLCLCAVCGSFLLTCPVCSSIKTASLHVNLSS